MIERNRSDQLTDQQSWLPIVVDERREHQEQRMLGRQMLQVVGAVIVHYDLLQLSPPEQLLALASRHEISEGGLAELEPTPVETIRTVDVDGAAHVIHVVQDKRSAVEDDRRGGGGSRDLEMRETMGQVVGSDDASSAQHQLTMKSGVLRAGTGGQTGGLQFAALRGRRQVLSVMVQVVKMMMMMVVMVEVQVVKATAMDVVAVAIVAVHLLVYDDRRYLDGAAAAVAVDIVVAAAAAAAAAAGATVAAEATVLAADDGRGDRRRGWRRREGTGTRSRFAQAAVQHELQVGPRPTSRHRLAT